MPAIVVNVENVIDISVLYRTSIMVPSVSVLDVIWLKMIANVDFSGYRKVY